MSVYNRKNPSSRYRELVELYRQMHEEGEKFLNIPAESTFTGKSLLPHVARIRELVIKHSARSVLDYGCGKAMQYRDKVKLPDGREEFVKSYWGIDSLTCYDPSYIPLRTLPEGKFDGVISTDVLEHCPEQDVEWIIEEMFGYSKKFLFFNVACFQAAKRLPNGENAHCTVRGKAWWLRRIKRIAASHPEIEYDVIFDTTGTGMIPALRRGWGRMKNFFFSQKRKS